MSINKAYQETVKAKKPKEESPKEPVTVAPADVSDCIVDDEPDIPVEKPYLEALETNIKTGSK